MSTMFRNLSRNLRFSGETRKRIINSSVNQAMQNSSALEVKYFTVKELLSWVTIALFWFVLMLRCTPLSMTSSTRFEFRTLGRLSMHKIAMASKITISENNVVIRATKLESGDSQISQNFF